MTDARGPRPPTRSPSWPRVAAINIVVLIALLAIVELAARAVIFVLRGSSTAGLQERTLNLDYEPFFMYGPGWDARFA